MATYKQDPETGQFILKHEWNQKYSEMPMGRGPMFIIKGNFEPYISPVSGEVINSQTKRDRDMKKHGCTDYEPSLRAHVDKQVREDELKLDKAVDETVDAAIEAMPTRKKELLIQELAAGADAEYTRSTKED